MMRKQRIVMMVAAILLTACGEKGPTRLPDSGFQVAFESHRVASEMTIGKTVSADITVKNVSPVTWPSKPDHKDRYAVNLSYHWLDQTGTTVVFDGLRTPLPRDLKPGESVALKAAIAAPAKPGRYTLELTLVQEGSAWFSEKNDGAKVVLPVNVLDATPLATASATRAGANLLDERSRSAVSAKTEEQKGASAEPVKKRRGKKKKSVELAGSQQVNEKLPTKTDQPAVAGSRAKGTWFVQVASFPEHKAAESLAKKLADKGYETYIASAEVQGIARHRVRVGRLNDRAEAEVLQQTLKDREKLSQTMIAKQ